jgi:hypothetical protein
LGLSRRRYIQDRATGELIEITDGARPQTETARDAGALWGDRHYDGLRATDGADISTRTKHREYMKRAGLTTVDDFSQTWAKAREARERYYQRGGSIDRAAIERAIHQVITKK